jgi:NADH dehydrogenase FAD-containing subunit
VGVTGVLENACVLKELNDARKIRLKIIECFEIASNPNTSLQEKESLLRFVIVGAGTFKFQVVRTNRDRSSSGNK